VLDRLKITRIVSYLLLIISALLLLVSLRREDGGGAAEKTLDPRTRKLVRVDDIDVACTEYGEGEPLFMVTAYSTTMDMWDPRFVERLASKYKVIVFDNRGLGDTTEGDAPWSIDRFATDTTRLIEALGYDKANVLGWSLGGDIALSLAVNFPEKVDRMVIYAGDCGGPEKIEAPKYRAVLKEVISNAHVPFEWAFAALFPIEWMNDHPDYWRTFPFPRERIRPLNIARQNRAYEDWQGAYEELPAIKNPVLIVTGTEDVSTPPENADILAEKIEGSRLIRFEGAGHGLMYQYPDRLADAVIEFLSGPPD
jgi:pimeloyl-ACP methyl ester carboxylesterase